MFLTVTIQEMPIEHALESCGELLAESLTSLTLLFHSANFGYHRVTDLRL